MNPRRNRLSIALSDDELQLLQSVLNPALPVSTAARIMLMDSANYLQGKGLQQRRDAHVAKRPPQSQRNNDDGPAYDYSDGQ